MGLAETILLIMILVVATMVLIVLEICTPTFGVLTLAALACAAGAVYLCYTINGVAGIVATIVAVLGLPTYGYLAVKMIPRTPLGRALMLRRRAATPGEGTPEAEGLRRLVGRKTVAETILRPSGTVRIDGNRVVAKAESGMIDKGQPVQVIAATATHVVVRKLDS